MSVSTTTVDNVLLYHLESNLTVVEFSEAVVHQGLIPRKVTVLMVSQDSYNGKYIDSITLINAILHVLCFRIL